ncbi:MAG: ferredoxin [Spirochaetales bacterium]|nr:ferredoxin [Spirochaetales bacterium]
MADGMTTQTVTLIPQNTTVTVRRGVTLLEAVSQAGIMLNNLCGGDGICGRCKMIVRTGTVSDEVSAKLTRDEIRKGYVLACQIKVHDNLTVEIPKETFAREKVLADEDAKRFEDLEADQAYKEELVPTPLTQKVFLKLDEPSLANNMADHQRLIAAIRKQCDCESLQTGLKIIKSLYKTLRDHNYRVTATVGLRSEISELMNVEGGNTADENYMVVIDIGTTTIVSHLMDVNSTKTLGAKACFNSGGVYGREVTGRMIAAEKKGIEELQRLLVDDINQLIEGLAKEHGINPRNITAIVCAGNTAMEHFLLGLPTDNIRRSPYVPVSVAPSPIRAVEVGLEINARGLLYYLPGIAGWVGSDITAGILSTGIHEADALSLLVDIGTNGEIIVGNREWLMACSASAGPALEGASEHCGMRAEKGAIERVSSENGIITYETIGEGPPRGICGSGIIDLVAVLLNEDIINRSGKIIPDSSDRIRKVDGILQYVVAHKSESENGREVYITETDIENVVIAKAAIFAAMKIILERLDLSFDDIEHFFIAGAFGSYLSIENAITIGLIPNVERNRIHFVGNTSVKGAKIVAFYQEALAVVEKIRSNTTYYDLMGANDYVDEFRKAMFLPHTDIELFERRDTWQKA